MDLGSTAKVDIKGHDVCGKYHWMSCILSLALNLAALHFFACHICHVGLVMIWLAIV